MKSEGKAVASNQLAKDERVTIGSLIGVIFY